MTNRPSILASLALAILLASPITGTHADRERAPEARRDSPAHRVDRSPEWERRTIERRERERYELDRRHYHYRYYPPPGLVVEAIPRGHVVVPYRDTRYYFYGGIWYRPSGTRYVVVTPPIGLTVSVLPPYYTTVWVGGVPYYYAGGVYYVWRPVERVYEVVEPPREREILAIPPEPEQLFVYPKLGQSEQQQANDRYECHRWAVEQTDFDPTLPGGGVPESQIASKRADYQRATKACLEARGYSVR